jgi:hypothetical protein
MRLARTSTRPQVDSPSRLRPRQTLRLRQVAVDRRGRCREAARRQAGWTGRLSPAHHPRRSGRRTPCQRFAFGAGDTGAWRSQDGFCGARAATSAKPVEARFPRQPARPITPGLVVFVAETHQRTCDFLTPRRAAVYPSREGAAAKPVFGRPQCYVVPLVANSLPPPPQPY